MAAAEVDRLRAVYGSDGADDRLVHDVFEGIHEFHGVEAFGFLDHWMGPGDAVGVGEGVSSVGGPVC